MYVFCMGISCFKYAFCMPIMYHVMTYLFMSRVDDIEQYKANVLGVWKLSYMLYSSHIFVLYGFPHL